jgi:hypothetical protein
MEEQSRRGRDLVDSVMHCLTNAQGGCEPRHLSTGRGATTGVSVGLLRCRMNLGYHTHANAPPPQGADLGVRPDVALGGRPRRCGSDAWTPSRSSEVQGMPKASVKQFARFGVVVESREYLPGESADTALEAFAERYPNSTRTGKTPEAFPVEIVESGDPFFKGERL